MPIVSKYESFSILEPSGPVRGGIGIDLPIHNEDMTSPLYTEIANCLWKESLHLADQYTCIQYICRNIVQSLIYLKSKKETSTRIQCVRYLYDKRKFLLLHNNLYFAIVTKFY